MPSMHAGHWAFLFFLCPDSYGIVILPTDQKRDLTYIRSLDFITST